MQNGVTFTGGISPKWAFEINIEGVFTYDREKCKTVPEVKYILPQVRFRTFHATRQNKRMSARFWAQIMDFAL